MPERMRWKRKIARTPRDFERWQRDLPEDPYERVAAIMERLDELREMREGPSFRAMMQRLGDHDLREFVSSYIEAALWSSTDNSEESGGSSLDENFNEDDVAVESIEEAIAESKAFIETNKDLLDAVGNYSQHGHDFWLTRNGHGVGFCDRGYGEIGEKLTEAAEAYGGKSAFVSDYGQIYFQPG